MKVWYLSEQRFINRIEKGWEKRNIKGNAGNINILRYAYRTVLYWSSIKKQKVSKQNRDYINNFLNLNQ